MQLLALARRRAYDAIVLALAAAVQVEIWLSLPDRDWRLSLAGLFATLPLLLRASYPLAAPLTAIAGAAASALVNPTSSYESATFFFSVLLAAWTVGAQDDRRKAAVGLAALIALDAFVTTRFPDQAVADFLWVAFALAGVWLAGLAVAHRARQLRSAEERAQRAEAERTDEARRAVAEERARIARELHDVVAHSVSVMTVQAGGVRRLLRDDQQREREALETIEETGREALGEMRRLLGILRQPAEQPQLAPQPGMRRLDALLEQVREAGLPVELRVEGEAVALPPGIDVSAYRVVQEALTNALKHAGPARARVRVVYGSDAVELEITNDGRGNGGGDGTGHGLAGMRERVALYGGELESGPGHDGGYEVRARLPLREPTA